jgi:spore maturation protein CgeB
LVGSPVLLDACKNQGLKAHLVYHYFDTDQLTSIENTAVGSQNFTFIGSSGYGYAAHEERYQMLMDLLHKTSIELWIDEPMIKSSFKQWFRSTIAKLTKAHFKHYSLKALEALSKVYIAPAKIKKLLFEEIEMRKFILTLPNGQVMDMYESGQNGKKPLCWLFPTRCHSPLFGLEMLKTLRQSKVVFNKHSIPAKGTVDNIRLFQATGVGACLLTDTGHNMSDLFEEDREVVTYTTVDECVEKISYLLDHESVRTQIALAGQARTFKDHNATVRIREIHNLIQLLSIS